MGGVNNKMKTITTITYEDKYQTTSSIFVHIVDTDSNENFITKNSNPDFAISCLTSSLSKTKQASDKPQKQPMLF